VGTSALAEAVRRAEVVALAARASPELARALGPDLEAAMLHDMRLERLEREVVSALAAAGVTERAALKGTAAGHWLYPEAGLRFRRDLDVLVGAGDFDRACDGLREAGLEAAPCAAWYAREAAPYEAAYRLDRGGARVECDVHQRLTVWRALPIDHAGFLQRAVELGPQRLPVSNLEDTLLHTCLHLATTGYQAGLRGWLDAARAFEDPRLEWPTLETRARVWKLAGAVWAAYEVCRRWFGVVTGAEMASELAPAAARARPLRWLLGGAGETPLRGSPHAARALALGGPGVWAQMIGQRAAAGFRTIVR
jgi:hypothetical protein